MKNDFAGAIKNYDNAVKLGASDAILFNNRGKAKLNLKDAAGSIADFDKAIQLKGDYTKAYLNRGTAKYSLKDYAGTASDLEKAKAEGETPEVLTMLAISNYMLGKKEVAKPYLDKAMQAGVKDGKVALYAGYLRFD